jgi:sugar phosphate isomerase/epimerase
VKLIVFSKMLKDLGIEQLIDFAKELGIDGYDMAVRPGYPVNPHNVEEELPKAAQRFRAAGLDIAMVTAHTGVLMPDEEGERLMAAMDAAGVRRLKLGYFKFVPGEMDYWHEVDKARKALEGWAELAQKYNVRACYHTHSQRCLGLNAGTLAHLIRGFDPQLIGAFLDAGHLRAEGEEFAVAVAIVREHLSMVAVKDFLLQRIDVENHGAVKRRVVEAGQGMCDWTAIFSELKRIGFDGPVSIHCEFEAEESEMMNAIRREAAFFKALTEKVGA